MTYNPLEGLQQILPSKIRSGDFVQIVYSEDCSEFESVLLRVGSVTPIRGTSEWALRASSRTAYTGTVYNVPEPAGIGPQVYLVHRPQKDLPTTLGSIIADVETSKGVFDYALLLSGGWVAVQEGRWCFIDPHDTLTWNEAKVVSRNEQGI